jgi:hypothetical protein
MSQTKPRALRNLAMTWRDGELLERLLIFLAFAFVEFRARCRPENCRVD